MYNIIKINHNSITLDKGVNMISRLVKVITNKPTQIERPVFLKHFKKENKQIKELEELLKTCNENSRKFIEQDIKNLKYGQIGENNVYYELKNSFIPMICLHDIRLKYRGKVAQIDFLIITSKYIYVIECKNLPLHYVFFSHCVGGKTKKTGAKPVFWSL